MIVKDRTLYVKVLEAKHVFPDKGRHSDSYCSVAVEGGEERRTPTVYRDASPFFGEELVFSDQLPSDMGPITIGMWQDQRHANTAGTAAVGCDKSLGRVVFPSDLLEDGRFEDEQWYSLVHSDPNQFSLGEVKLGLKLEAAAVKGKFTLTVGIDEARNLKPGQAGNRDVFVVMHLIPDPKAGTTQKTSAARSTLNPVYNLDFHFQVTDSYKEQELHVSLWDVKSQDSFLGHLSVPLNSLERNGRIDPRWRGLLPPTVYFAKQIIKDKSSMTESNTVDMRVKAFLLSMQAPVKELARKKNFHKLIDTKFVTTVSFCGHCGLALSPGRMHLQCSLCKVSCHLVCSKVIANNCGEIGAVRLKIKYSASTILPLENYRPFLDLLSQDKYRLAHLFGKVSKDREEAAWPLIKLMEADECTQQFLLAIIHAEIEDTDDPNNLFRGNSMASKAVDVYMRYLGKGYLKSTIGDIVKNIVSKKLHCELDPMKMDKGEDLDRNRKVLTDLNQRILNAIYDTRFALPAPWRPIFARVQAEVTYKFPYDSTVRYTSVSGFIFLRFFAPAILGPKLFDLVDEYIDPKTSRTLTLLAKTLQTLANLVPFGDKEPYMKQMNPFIEANIDKMKTYIDGLAARELVTPNTVSLHYVRFETAREAARLFNLFVRAAPAILQTMTEDDAPIVRKLAKILTRLTIETTAKDGIDYNPFSFPSLKQSYANLLNMRMETKPIPTKKPAAVSPPDSRRNSVAGGTLTEMLQNAADEEFGTLQRTGHFGAFPGTYASPAPMLNTFTGRATPLSFGTESFSPLFKQSEIQRLGILDAPPTPVASRPDGIQEEAETPVASGPTTTTADTVLDSPTLDMVAAAFRQAITSPLPILSNNGTPVMSNEALNSTTTGSHISLKPTSQGSDSSENESPRPLRPGSARSLPILTPIATAMSVPTSPWGLEMKPHTGDADVNPLSLPSASTLATPGSASPRRTPRGRPTGASSPAAQNQSKLGALAIMAMLSSARESVVDQVESSLTCHGECSACKKNVIGSEFMKMEGRVWHTEHFACTVCAALISDPKNADLHDGSLYCSGHRRKQCASCKGSIDETQNALVALGDHYHPHCFVCRACGSSLSDGFMNFEGAALCQDDYYKQAGLMCGGCGGKIPGDYIQIGARKYHIDCKRCDKCLHQLANKPYFILQDSVYCSAHIEEMLTCSTCGTLVAGDVGQIVRLASGRTYHPSCFCCMDCRSGLQAGFYECGGWPKCENCYVKSFG
ncbi:hypothetical protein HKX48_005415 [Thoreauomyces humboldtii]|nr:hypothetical protein HKX48_005415 [Thoreauomyces humboldtii]